MKIKTIELGSAKEKMERCFLWDKTHNKSIILKYSFEELETVIEKEIKRNESQS